MESDTTSISRLGRIELTGRDYSTFIQPLFRGDKVADRIRYIEWLLGNNPTLPARDALPIFVYRDSSEPIGQLGIIPVETVFGGEKLLGGWCVDFFVSPKAQRRGIGAKLLHAAYEDFPLLLTLGQTDLAFNLFSKLGWHDCGTLTLYRTLLNHTTTVPKLLLKKAGLSFGGKKRSESHRPFSAKNEHATVEELTSFSDFEIPQLHDDSDEFYVQRSEQFMDWRYLEVPFASYTVLSICLNGRTNIAAVLRMTEENSWSKAKLIDLLYPFNISTHDLNKALNLIKAFVSSRGAEHFECKTSDHKLLEALPKSMFSTSTPAERFLYSTADGIKQPVVSIDKWKLYVGDCDLDSVEAYQASAHA